MERYITTHKRTLKYMSISKSKEKKLFAVSCDQFNLGTVFLIWSIHYLSGHDTYYNIRERSYKKLIDNPLKGVTAHKMDPNDFTSMESCRKIINDRLTFGCGPTHFKYTPMVDTIKDYHKHNRLFHKLMTVHGIQTINVTCKNLQHLIGFLRFNTVNPDWQDNIEKVKKHCEHYWPDFFINREIYNDNLETLHDIREGIAFNIRPYDFWEHYNSKHKDKNILICQFENLVFKGEEVLKDICLYLRIPIDKTKKQNWRIIHQQWSATLSHYINFCNDLEIIVKNIVSGKSMDLKPYKMDVLKEGIVLHLLMFRHDLNLMTIIEKMPNNTREISKLLGKNPRTGIKSLYSHEQVS